MLYDVQGKSLAAYDPPDIAQRDDALPAGFEPAVERSAVRLRSHPPCERGPGKATSMAVMTNGQRSG